MTAAPIPQTPVYPAGTSQYSVNPSIATLADGGYVVAYVAQDAGNIHLYAQRNDVDGMAVDPPLQVDSSAISSVTYVDVAALVGGGYVVAWNARRGGGIAIDLFTQRFDSDGQPQGVQTQVNGFTIIGLAFSAVTGLADGGYAVTWADEDPIRFGTVYVRRYGLDGSAQGDAKPVDLDGSGQEMPAIAVLADGSHVVTWAASTQASGGVLDIYARHDAADGTPGTETIVNTTLAFGQTNPAIAALASGGYVVTWDSRFQVGNSFDDRIANGSDVFAQRYDADGHPVGVESQVNTSSAGNQLAPSVAPLANGGYVVTWDSDGQDGSSFGVYAQRYGADGQRVGDEFRVNPNTVGDQAASDVTTLASGRMVVAFQDLAFNQVEVVTLVPVNDPPTTSAVALTAIAEDSGARTITAAELLAQAHDADGPQFLSVTDLHIAVGQGSLTPNVNGTWSYTPGPNDDTAVSFSYTISDGTDTVGGSASLDILPVNDAPPVAVPDAAQTRQNTAVNIAVLANDSDIDGSPLSVAAVGQGSNGSVAIGLNSQSVTYTPNPGFAGFDNFSYTVSDGQGGLTSANVRVLVVSRLGTAGNDSLQGTSAVDYMLGLGGRDTLRGNGGNDTIDGGSGNDTLYGGEGNDDLRGGEGNDVIYGDAGADTIYGGAGNDWLYGGPAGPGDGTADTFVFNTALDAVNNVDWILNFEANGLDRIALDAGIFTAVAANGTPGLDAGEFASVFGGVALDANDYIVFDPTDGKLYYDADGAGPAGRVQFARVSLFAGVVDVSDFVLGAFPA